MVKASERHHRRRSDQGETGNRHQLKRRKPHDEQNSADRNRGLVPPDRPLGAFGQVVEHAVLEHLAHPAGRPFDQHRVADPEAQLVNLAGHVLAAAMDGEDVHAVKPGKSETRKTAPDKARLRPDYAFHHHGFSCLHGLERGRRICLRAQRHIAGLLERQHLGHRRAQHHPVTRLQHDGLQVVAKRQPLAEYVDDCEALLRREAGLGDGLADQVGVQGDQDLRHEPALFLVRQHRGQRLAVGQKERAKDRRIENPDTG